MRICRMDEEGLDKGSYRLGRREFEVERWREVGGKKIFYLSLRECILGKGGTRDTTTGKLENLSREGGKEQSSKQSERLKRGRPKEEMTYPALMGLKMPSGDVEGWS
jgi:hypothetical protein